MYLKTAFSLFGGITCVLQANLGAANLWPGDSSFETASDNFIVPRDAKYAYDGKYSLRIDPGVDDSGHKVFLVKQPNTDYVIAFYAKSEKPATITAISHDDFWGWNGHANFNIGPEWTRCVMPLKKQNQITSVTLSVKPPADQSIWIDAVGLYKGTQAEEYHPANAIDLGFSTVEPVAGLLYCSNQPVKSMLSCRNNTNNDVEVELTGALENASTRETTQLFNQKIKLDKGELFETPVTVLEQAGRGYCVMRAKAVVNGKSVVHAQPFVVVDPPLPVSMDSFFGIHFSNGVMGRNIGAAWSRTFDQWSWRIPDKDGNYHIGSKGLTHITTQYGVRQLRCINLHGAPAVLKDKDGKSKDEDIAKYVGAMTKAYNNVFQYIELENEPDLVYPNQPEEYARLLKLVVPEVRKYAPDAKIVGASVSGVDFNQNFIYVDKVLADAGNLLDVISVHPYTYNHYVDATGGDIGPEKVKTYERALLLREMIKKHGGNQEIWYGEVGWAPDVTEDFLSDVSRRNASYIPRLMVLSKAAGVKRVFYFLIETCLERERYNYGVWRSGKPLPGTATYAGCAQILEGAESLGVIVNNDYHIFPFLHRDGRLFAVVWTSNGSQTKLTLPLAKDEVGEVRDMFNNPVSGTFDNGKCILPIDGEVRYLFVENLSRKEFLQRLSDSQCELPPLKILWELASGSSVIVNVENIRTQKLAGSLSISGAEFANPERPLTLEPAGTARFKFNAKSPVSGKRLELIAKTDLGDSESSYRAELLACPPGTPALAGALAADRRLPRMDSRNYLLPNDPTNGWDGPANLSVESLLRYDKNYLYILIDVRDDIHVQTQKPGRLWSQDSIQLVIDTKGNAQPNAGFDKDDYEFGFGLSNGQAQKELTYTYDSGRATAILDAVKCNIFRQDDKTCYRIAIPWKSIKAAPEPGMIFGLNFTANDHDGAMLRYWMGLTPGIVDAKNPAAYKKFLILPEIAL